MAEVNLKVSGLNGNSPDGNPECVVTRRLYRNGESEYLMNGQVCRLRDIHELFMDTGLGSKAYSIIEQGKIGQILSGKPADRRALIEEAAGITKYRARRRQTQLKLEAAQQNLLRVNDIVHEVEKQLESLKRQAGKARRYRAGARRDAGPGAHPLRPPLRGPARAGGIARRAHRRRARARAGGLHRPRLRGGADGGAAHRAARGRGAPRRRAHAAERADPRRGPPPGRAAATASEQIAETEARASEARARGGRPRGPRRPAGRAPRRPAGRRRAGCAWSWRRRETTPAPRKRRCSRRRRRRPARRRSWSRPARRR